MTRMFHLTAGNVRVQIGETDGPGAQKSYGWDVSVGKRHIRSGVSVCADLRTALRRIVGTVTMPSKLAAGRLRAISTYANPSHVQVPAGNLRGGDLLHIGGTNYVLVHSVTVDRVTGEVVIRPYNGTEPVDGNGFRRGLFELCNLARRDARPVA